MNVKSAFTNVVSVIGMMGVPTDLSKNNGAKTEADVYNNGVYYCTCSRCTYGDSNDYCTSHYNVVNDTQKHFNMYVGNSHVQKIYVGDTLIYNLNIGDTSLVV